MALQKALHPFRPRSSRAASRAGRGPRHQQGERKPVLALVLQAARGHRHLRHRHRRHAFLRRAGAELGRRGHEILAADQRPLGMDRAALLLEERAGDAEREVGQRQFAVAPSVRASARPGAVDGRLGRGEAGVQRLAPFRRAWPRPAPAAVHPPCATPARAGGSRRRSPCGRRSFRFGAGLRRADHRVHQPLQRRHDVGRGHRRRSAR